MKKDVAIENWIIRGTVFILIFTFSCFVWFQYQMSTIERYDGNYNIETRFIVEPSVTGQNESLQIEINDDIEQDTGGNNSTDTEETDVLKSERNIEQFHSSKS